MDARALIVLALAAACAGPDPSAQVVAVERSPEPGHERAMVAVRNAGAEGEIRRSSSRCTRRVAARVRETKTIDMESARAAVADD